MKFNWKFFWLIFFLIKLTESSSLTFELQNNSKIIQNFDSTFECNSSNFEHENLFTNSSTQIFFFKFCNPLAILTDPNFLTSVENSKFLSVLIFEKNLRIKNFTTSEISKIDSVFSKKLKRPILLSIHSEATDNEILYEIAEGRLSDASTVNEFLSKFNNETLRSDAISDAIKKNCALCMRIANILDEKYLKNLKLDGDDGKCDIDCIRALLLLPHDEKLEEIPESVFIIFHQFYIGKIKNYENENETKSDLEDLASMAWKNKEFKIFDFLIRADFKFPQNFIDDMEKKFKSRNKFVAKVESYIKKVETFHDNIRSGKVEAVREFLNSHKFLRFARNSFNVSALEVALNAEQFEIYSLLKGHGMSVGDVAELLTQKWKLKKLSEQKKLKIRQFNHDHLIEIEENFISKLIHQTSIYFDTKFYQEENLVKIIREAFLEVNQSFPEILEVSSKSKNVEIIFNFESSDVDDYDPQGDAVGLTSRQLSYIFIGAKDLLSDDIDEKNYVLGTIAHEFMHFAMYLMYDNDGNPYAIDDLETTNLFTNITEKCEEKQGEESSIEIAFSYKDDVGDGKVYHLELIARVPDITLTYKNNLTHLENVKLTFNELFEFYDEKILPDLRKMIPKMEVKEVVREFNQWFKVLKEIDANVMKVCGNVIESDEISQIQRVMKNLNLNSSLDVHAITTNSISFALKKIQQETKKEEILTIFTKLSFADFENFVKVLYDIDNLKTEIILVILCDNFDHMQRFKSMIDESSFEHAIFVAKTNWKKYLGFYLDDIQNLNFTFKDLCEESQKLFMKYPINFQGSKTLLEDFVEGIDEEIFELFEIENLFKNTNKIGVELDKNEKYLVKLKVDDGKLKDVEEFVKEIYKSEMKILEDENFTSSEENNSENVSENEIEDDAIAKESKSQMEKFVAKFGDRRKVNKTLNDSKFIKLKKGLKKHSIIYENQTQQSSAFNDNLSTTLLNDFNDNLSTTFPYDLNDTLSTTYSNDLNYNLSTTFPNDSNYNLSTTFPNDLSSSLDFEFIETSTFDFQTSQNSTIKIQESFERITKKPNTEIFILSSKPGSGKSLAMKEIALNIKKVVSSKWVIFIDLENFVDLDEERLKFEKSNLDVKNDSSKVQSSNLELKVDSALKLNQSSKVSKNLKHDEIFSILTQRENEVSVKFLTKFLENPQKIVILFDSFDKAENPEKVLNFIEKCQKFTSQIWISTRPHRENLLTKKFKSSKVIKISPLNHKSRESFLEYFSHLDEVEEKKLMKVVEEIEVDEIQLLNEIVESWSENFYEMFSKILRQRYAKVKVKNFDDFEENLSFKLKLHKEHQKIALKFLDFKQISSLKIMEENFNLKSEEILNFGIVQKNKSFTEIFRQFYVAQFLIESLTKNETEKIVAKLLIEILERKNEKSFKMTVKFLKDYVKLHEDESKIVKIQEILIKNK